MAVRVLVVAAVEGDQRGLESDQRSVQLVELDSGAGMTEMIGKCLGKQRAIGRGVAQAGAQGSG